MDSLTSGEPFSADVIRTNGTLVVEVRGEIDLAVSEQLRSLLVADLDVVVDLSMVSFIDSSGIAALLKAHRSQTANGHRLEVRGAHGTVSRVLEITGADSVLRRAN